MKLKVLKGANPGQEFDLANGEFHIGRETDNDFVIAEASVSRHHCRVFREGERWLVEDLQSMYGVSVNGEKITAPTELHEQDVILVYDHEFEASGLPVRADAPESMPTVPPSAPSVSGPAVETAEKTAPVAKLIALAVILVAIAVLAWNMVSGGKREKQPGQTEVQAPAESAKPAGDDGTSKPKAGSPMLTADDLNSLKPEAIRPQHQADPSPIATSEPQDRDNGDNGNIAQDLVETAARAAAAQEMARNAPQTILVESNPPGAEVYLDERKIGVTPAVVRDVEQGSHLLELTLKGYEKFAEQLRVDTRYEGRPFPLTLRARTLLMETTPTGAAVWEGRQLKGTTPLLLENLPEGEHVFNVIGPGCKPYKATVRVEGHRGEKVSYALESNLGALEITTRPSGCRVLVNGVQVGVTAGDGRPAAYSQPLRVDSLLGGKCVVKVEHPLGVSLSGNVEIQPGKVHLERAKLWVPSHRLTLQDGNALDGMLLEETPQGDVAMEFARGRTARYVKPEIATLRPLSREEVREVLGKQTTPQGTGQAAASLGRQGYLQVKAAELERHASEWSAERFNNAYAGRKLAVTGPTISRAMEGGVITAFFSIHVQCKFSDGATEDDYQALVTAAENQAPVTIGGTCTPIKNGVVILRDCLIAE
ncbi:MAG: PEGA domain-containing protein [Victivallales bacterium]|nr:PEGA domain-containing protein [Victivallales bacterium]